MGTSTVGLGLLLGALAVSLLLVVTSGAGDPVLYAQPPCEIQMRIFDGQNGRTPSHADQITRGAFTVLNENDTNDNDAVDRSEEDLAKADFDLMKLALGKPSPDEGGGATLEVFFEPIDHAEIRIWDSATKDNELVPPFSIPTANLPMTLWVEGVKKSGTVRDIFFIWSYTMSEGTCSDRATATIVWAEQTDVKHDTSDAVWSGFPDPPKSTHNRFCGGGFGLRAIGNRPLGVRNCVGIQFKIFPAGVWDEPGVKFDITRQVAGRSWEKKSGGEFKLSKPQMFPVDFPAGDKPNDDQSSRQDNDESTAPDANGHMYVVDGPGADDDDAGRAAELVIRWNFKEFVRVRFDGREPQGNKEDGSRSSDKFDWHVRHHLQRGSSSDPWTRSTGDAPETAENDVATDHIVVGDQP